MSDNINFNYKNLSPFKWFVLENFPFIEADFDAITDWQLFNKIGNEINKIIDSQNIVGEQAETLTNTFNNFKNYVDNYFENLDVQNEIDNKLDKMSEDGTLQQIIESFLKLNTTICYNNIEELKKANIQENSFALVLGDVSIGDGYIEIFKIFSISQNDNDITLENGLFAHNLKNEKIEDSIFYDEITCEEKELSPYNPYWITHIPHLDKKGKPIELKLGFANDNFTDNGDLEYIAPFAKRNKATVAINAGISDNDSNLMSGQKYGLRVIDGKFISNVPSSYWQIHWALGITYDGKLVTFGPSQSFEQAQALNCKYVTSGMTPVLIDGVSQKFLLEYTNTWFEMTQTTDELPDSTKIYYTKNTSAPFWTPHENLSNFEKGITYYEIKNTKYQKQYIAQNSKNLDIYILTSNGKGQITNTGITNDEAIEILTSYGCDFIYQLDGGGSTSLEFKGQFLNQESDKRFRKQRPLGDFLYVAKDKPFTQKDKDILYNAFQIGEPYDRVKRLTNRPYYPTASEGFTLTNIILNSKNDRVAFNANIDGNFINDANLVANLPKDLWPQKYIQTICFGTDVTNYYPCLLQITTKGEVKILTHQEMTNARFNIVYDLDT